MAASFKKPVVIATAVVIIGAALVIINYSNLVRRPPLTPPGTTYHAVKDAGAVMSPTQPESQIKVSPAGPEPLTPPSGK